ncbi:6-phosphofructo-2-kinase [Fusarium falciforme]
MTQACANLPRSLSTDAGRKQSKQSALAKLVMHSLLGRSPPASPRSSPKPPVQSSSSSTAVDSDISFTVRPPVDDGHLSPPLLPSMAAALRGLSDSTETPPYARSVTSTAPSSPRMLPVRQNSGSQNPRVRPHASTLNIPGMTRSMVSPDGRIARRDVAAKLVIVMVGLPARGKSYITKKLQRYLSWQQHDSRIFNVGNRRRVAAGRKVPVHLNLMSEPGHLDPPLQAAAILLNGVPEPHDECPSGQRESELPDLNDVEGKEENEIDQSAQFFDPKNESAAALREQVAMDTLDELLDYLLLHGGSVGILDATNSTIQRRQNIVNRIRHREPRLGVLFVESICHDPTLLEANMRLKLSGPDYRDKDPQKSLEDFKKRVAAYESAYVPLGPHEEEQDMQYIQMIEVGRKLIQYRLKGFMSNEISHYLASFSLAPRQIWITRHGQTVDNELGKLGGDSPLTERGHYYGLALHRFITYKRKQWLIEQKNKLAQATFPPLAGGSTPPFPEMNRDLDNKNFCVWTSMLQRSVETAEYFEADDDYDVKNWEILNEMNTGQLEGMTCAEIAKKYPEEYQKRAKDKLNYIYPGVGGEGYLQVVSRLRDMVREVERIEDHVMIIGHCSICRVLMAYFMDLSLADITDMAVPLGMLYAIEPKPYGIAFHAYQNNEALGWFDEMANYWPEKNPRGSV